MVEQETGWLELRQAIEWVRFLTEERIDEFRLEKGSKEKPTFRFYMRRDGFIEASPEAPVLAVESAPVEPPIPTAVKIATGPIY